MNRYLVNSMIQKQFRGVAPGPTITAPLKLQAASLITEAERLAQFEHSANFHASRSAATSPPLAQAGRLASHRFNHDD